MFKGLSKLTVGYLIPVAIVYGCDYMTQGAGFIRNIDDKTLKLMETSNTNDQTTNLKFNGYYQFIDKQFRGYSWIAITSTMFYGGCKNIISTWTLTGYLFSCFWNRDLIYKICQIDSDNQEQTTAQKD